MFAQRLAGVSIAGIARSLNERGVACPSVVDPTRNRHRRRGVWAVRSVASILGNPQYTGWQVWNRQPVDHGRDDGGRIVVGQWRRWSGAGDWVVSRRRAHPALVSEEDFVAPTTDQVRRVSAWVGACGTPQSRYERCLGVRCVEQEIRACRASYDRQFGAIGSDLPPSPAVVRPGCRTPSERHKSIFDGRQIIALSGSRPVPFSRISGLRNHLVVMVPPWTRRVRPVDAVRNVPVVHVRCGRGHSADADHDSLGDVDGVLCGASSTRRSPSSALTSGSRGGPTTIPRRPAW